MPFDASVIADIGGSGPDITGSIAKGLTLADLYDQHRVRRGAMKEHAEEQADMTYAKDVLAKVTDLSDPEQQNRALSMITKRSPALGMKLMKDFREQASSKNEYDVGQIKLMEAKNDIIGGLLMQLKTKHDGIRQATPNASEQQIHDAMQGDVLTAVKQVSGMKLPNGQPVLNDQDRQQLQQGLGQGYNVGFIDSLVGRSKQAGAAIKQRLEEQRAEYQDRETVTIMKGGKPHKVLVDKRTGSEIKDLGPTTEAASIVTMRDADKDLLKPDTLDLAVTDVMADPSHMRNYTVFGRAGKPIRDQVNDAVAAHLKEAGMTPNDLVRLRARIKGEAASTVKLTQQKNAIESFEKLARANGERVLELLDKIDSTGVPMIEGWTRRASKAAGDPDTAEFASVLNTFQTEVSRAITNPNMTGVLSDSAREEFQKIAPANMSAAQGKRVINRLFTEMDLRSKFIDEQIQESGAHMEVPRGTTSSPPPVVPAAQAPPPGGGAAGGGGTPAPPPGFVIQK